MSRVFVSTGAFRTRDLQDILAQADAAGINRVELSSGVAPVEDPAAAVSSAPSGLTFLVHNYFPAPFEPFVLNLASLDEEIGRRTEQHCDTALALSEQVGAGFYSIHAGFAADLRPAELGRPDAQVSRLSEAAIPRDAAYEAMVARVRRVADRAAARNLDLLIENNVLSPHAYRETGVNYLLLCDGAEVARFMNDVARPNVGLLLDVGHAKVSATALDFSPESFVETAAPWVRAFHLSDNDGLNDQNRVVEPRSWFCPLLADFPSATVVIEAYNLTTDRILSQRDLVENLLA